MALKLKQWLELKRKYSDEDIELAEALLEAFVDGKVIIDYVPSFEKQPPMKFSIHPSHGVDGKIKSFIVKEHQ